MVFVRQGAQRLGQQAGAIHVDVQVALARLVHGPFGTNNIPQIPALDLGQGRLIEALAVEVQLDLAGAVLNQQERAAVANQTPGDSEALVLLFELLLAARAVFALQVSRPARAPEVVGEGVALRAQLSQLAAPLGDQLVLLVRAAHGLILLFHNGVLQPFLQ